jgi:hypothetical protein
VESLNAQKCLPEPDPELNSVSPISESIYFKMLRDPETSSG